MRQNPPHITRTWEALKEKYSKLVRHQKPTGDPTCPPHVKRAKYLQQAIDNRVDTGEIDDDNLLNSLESGLEHSLDNEFVDDDTFGNAFYHNVTSRQLGSASPAPGRILLI